MAKRDLVVIGASAGGLEALRDLCAGLPATFSAATLVVLHLPPASRSALPAILSRSGKLPVAHARDGDPLVPGRVLVAPPDHHLVVHGDRVRLTAGPRVNAHRPAIEPLFTSAARARGARVISVVLSGTLDDGTFGTAAVRRAGGATCAQLPADALYDGMPTSAIERGGAVHVHPIAELARVLMDLAAEDVPHDQGEPTMPDLEHELALTPSESATAEGHASGFTCPACKGALWELRENELVRYRCRTGHWFAQETLAAEQSDAIEAALWAGYRALAESAALAKKLAARSSGAIAARYMARHDDAIARAKTLKVLLDLGTLEAQDAGSR